MFLCVFGKMFSLNKVVLTVSIDSVALSGENLEQELETHTAQGPLPWFVFIFNINTECKFFFICFILFPHVDI